MNLYEELCDKVTKNEAFSFTRWGDGEWASVLGRIGENCDGHKYYNSLKRALRAALLRQNATYYGMQPKARKDMGAEIDLWLAADRLESVQWVNADMFHDASKESLLVDFFKACENKRVVLVGPQELNMMRLYFPKLQHVVVPSQNAWLLHENIRSDLAPTSGDIFLFCCGLMSNVLISELDKKIMLNMGSVFQPYCGLCTRKYHSEVLRKLGEKKCE